MDVKISMHNGTAASVELRLDHCSMVWCMYIRYHIQYYNLLFYNVGSCEMACVRIFTGSALLEMYPDSIYRVSAQRPLNTHEPAARVHSGMAEDFWLIIPGCFNHHKQSTPTSSTCR